MIFTFAGLQLQQDLHHRFTLYSTIMQMCPEHGQAFSWQLHVETVECPPLYTLHVCHVNPSSGNRRSWCSAEEL